MGRPKKQAADTRQYPLHDHCKNCGACLNTGLIHRCGTPIREDIAEVMADDIAGVRYSRQDEDYKRLQATGRP